MSAKDPIEELFRDNQHGLDEQPRGLIWDKIEERLDEKSVQKKKLNVWKYAVAASVVFAVGIGLFALLNNQNQATKIPSQQEISYEEPVEINPENASEILDKIEEKNQSVVINEKKMSAPEIMENKLEENPTPKLQTPEPMVKPEPVYDVAPVASKTYETPIMKETEAEIYTEEKAKVAEETIASRTEVSEKRANYFLSKKEDVQRMGNMADVKIQYDKNTSDTLKTTSFWVRTSNSDILYKIGFNSKDSAVFTNPNVDFPKKIIVIRKGTDFNLIYKGNSNHQNSKESQEIQSYINQNKNAIFNSEIQID